MTASAPVLAAKEIVLEAKGMTKRYGGVLALDDVTFRLYRNQVNVLIGENGAGKSTLMRILAGVEQADEGTLLLNDEPVALRSPREASAHGIAIVHQELSVLPNLEVNDNVFAGREISRLSLFTDQAAEAARSRAALKRLRKPIDVHAPASSLSLGNRQIVEIARAIDQGAKILILDEPTSALSTAETDSLFEVIADLKREGVTIVYISHRLHELLHLGDRFTVLRSGKVVGEAPRAEVTRQWIVERMSGRAEAGERVTRVARQEKTPALSVKGLTVIADGWSAQAQVRDLNFTLERGEVLGIYGLLGSGRTETLEALAGLRPIAAGEILVGGQRACIDSVTAAEKAGIALVPEDRQRDGLFQNLSIRENISIASSSKLFLDRKADAARVRTLVAELNIVAGDLELPVTALSGGNQQKVLLARCLMRSPAILLLDEPTRGVDVGAKAEIHRTLRGLAAQGLSILFTSSEIEETRHLADRVLVLCQGSVSAEFTPAELTDEALFAAASPNVTMAAGSGTNEKSSIEGRA